MKSLSYVWLFATPWTVTYKAPLSMEFSRQKYWSGLPFPSPGDLPDPGIKPGSPTLQTDTLLFEPPGKPNIFNHKSLHVSIIISLKFLGEEFLLQKLYTFLRPWYAVQNTFQKECNRSILLGKCRMPKSHYLIMCMVYGKRNALRVPKSIPIAYKTSTKGE